MWCRCAELEDVDRVGGGGDAEETGAGVERHAEDARRHGASPELVEFPSGRDREDADDGAFVGGCGEEGAGVVDGDAGEGRAVRFDDVYGLELVRVEDEHGAAGGCNMGRGGRCVGRRSEGGGSGFLGEGVGEVAVVGGWGEGADRYRWSVGLKRNCVSAIQPLGFGDVSIVNSSFMLLIS